MDIRTFVKNIGASFEVSGECNPDGTVKYLNVSIKDAERCSDRGVGVLSQFGRSENRPDLATAYEEAMLDLATDLKARAHQFPCLRVRGKMGWLPIPQELEFNFQPDPVCACGKSTPGECRSCR